MQYDTIHVIIKWRISPHICMVYTFSPVDGFDYIGLRNFSVVLSGQQIYQDIEIELTEDVMVEGREIFTVQVMSVDETLPISYNPQTRDIIINDNDSKFIIVIITFKSIDSLVFRSNNRFSNNINKYW